MQNDRHYNKEDLQPPRAADAPRAAEAPVASEAERAGDAPPASDTPAAHGKRSVLRRVWNVFTTVLVAIVVLFALLLVLVFVPDLLKRADKSAGKRESEQHQG